MKKLISSILELNSFENSLFIYSLSFSLLLTIAPFCIALVLSIQIFELDASYLIEILFHYLPYDFIYPFIDYLFIKNYNSLSLLSMFFSLYLSSRCIYSFLLISSSLEDIHYPLWSLRIYSIYEFIIIYVYILLYMYISTFLSKYTLLPIIFYFGASLLGFYTFYHLCTFKKQKKTYGLIGALFVTISLYLIGILFYKSISIFTNYESIYGPLSSFMIVLLLVYIIANIIYLGYILNNKFTNSIVKQNRKNTFFKNCDKIEKYIRERVFYENRN